MTTEIDKKKVGERLQHFREIRGLSRDALALKLCITPEDLRNLEDGKSALTKEHLETLRETFSVDPAWILGGEAPDQS
jgi:transcriptional regulator with XRE-family HTH domain